MTQQVAPTLSYLDQEWEIYQMDRTGWFDPTKHGLRPNRQTSCNWDGYVLHYGLEAGDVLRLVKITANMTHMPDDGAPPILGVQPVRVKAKVGRHVDAVYHMSLPIQYYGIISVARDFSEAEDDRTTKASGCSGYPFINYLQHRRLTLSNGALASEEDASAEVAAAREEFIRKKGRFWG